MMKKRTALTLLTATMMVTATAGTYAQWDKVTDTGTAKVTLREPVTVNAGEFKLTADSELNVTPIVTGTANFNVDNRSGKASSINLVPVVKETAGSNAVLTDKFEIAISDTTDVALSTETAGTFTDSSLDSTAYTVKLTPKSDAEEALSSVGELTVELTATLK